MCSRTRYVGIWPTSLHKFAIYYIPVSVCYHRICIAMMKNQDGHKVHWWCRVERTGGCEKNNSSLFTHSTHVSLACPPLVTKIWHDIASTIRFPTTAHAIVFPGILLPTSTCIRSFVSREWFSIPFRCPPTVLRSLHTFRSIARRQLINNFLPVPSSTRADAAR